MNRLSVGAARREICYTTDVGLRKQVPQAEYCDWWHNAGGCELGQKVEKKFARGVVERRE